MPKREAVGEPFNEGLEMADSQQRFRAQALQLRGELGEREN